MSADVFLESEIESPRPLRFVGGAVSIRGWCFATGQAEPPVVRARAGALRLTQTAREERKDVPRLFPDQTAARQCGFVVSGGLPAGVHLLTFEAQRSDGWRKFREVLVVVEPAPFAAVIDEPMAQGVLSDRVKAGGWALDPAAPVDELTLRYGHREIACVVGRPRRDVPLTHPEVPHAANTGFETADFLVAGHGPVRVRARLADGRRVVARTRVAFSIPHDEFHGPEIDLTAPRIPLPGYHRQESPEPESAAFPPRNILFLLPGSFASNSALHVTALADELVRRGHACAVAVTHDVATVAHHENPRFRALTQAEAVAGLTFADGRGPEVIHCWTTRENVRCAAETLRAQHGARLVVHLEDNERQLVALSTGRQLEELDRLEDAVLEALIPADRTHPRRGQDFLRHADGVTVITERLGEFVPSGKPVLTIRPSADSRYFFPRPIPDDFRRQLHLAPGELLLFYHGNVHAANAAEVRELYLALIELNRERPMARLVRTGIDSVDFLGPLAEQSDPLVFHLGHILHHRYLPPLMSLADVFVQPGVPDAFNDYRFPSKLPEFFALGRPVILPRTNLGRSVRHGVDAYVVERADAAGIAGALRELHADAGLRERLSVGAARFAAEHFSWPHSAGNLAAFYETLLS